MKFFYAQSLAWALGMAWLASPAQAQYPGQNTLLPIPAAAQSYPVAPVAHRDMWNGQQVPPAPQAESSPSDAPSILPAPPMAQPDQSVLSDDYRKAASGGWGDNNVVNDGSSCGPQGCGNPNYWYGYAGGLIMTRSQQNSFLITGDQNGTRLLCSCDLDMGWTGGVETTLGRTFNCGNNAIQFTYWGLYPQNCDSTAFQSTLGSPLVSGIDFTNATYNGNPVTNLSANGFMQRGLVSQQINNFEANLLGQCFGNGFIGGGMPSCQNGQCGTGNCGNYCGPRWGCGWMMGIRYFQFNNNFTLYADGADEVWNDDVNEFCYHLRLDNSLWGFQVGGGWNWNVLNCFQLYGLAKAGIYNNSIDQNMYLRGAGGTGTFGDGTDINVQNSANRLAMIGQLDLGGRWQFSQCFSVNAGYRIMAASGLALYEHNIPTDFNDSYYARKIESDGMLLLHGAYVGGEFRF
jgi:hypothetical protein